MSRRDTLQLLLLSAVWGASFILIEISGHSFPPAWVALLRLTFGALFLWAVLRLGRRSLPPARFIPALVAVALFNNAIPFIFFALGEHTVPSSIAAVLNATTPIWALLITMAVQSTRPNRFTTWGVLLGFTGVMVVVFSHGQDSQRHVSNAEFFRGVFFIALASLGYAIATVIAKIKLKGLDPIGLATTQLSLAWLMVLPVAAFGAHPLHIQRSSFFAVMLLGVAGSGLAYLLYFDLLSRIAATHVVAVTYLLPIWGLFWGFVAHEPILWTAYLGVVVVIGGLVLLNTTSFDQLKAALALPARKKPEVEVEYDAS
ncbi:DMT family transporter [Edaphobacter bradus]|uniref:DMT family transporter n=1 Tax=Edaphobacter bradus TaxID=2259016 RepID=UPI0021DFF9F8|nr:DMT family transporter [Edaphobacter bradus]